MSQQDDFFVTARVSGSNTVRTYVYLYKTANQQLKDAREKEEGKYFYLMGSIVFAAFTLEAFLNHVGAEKIPQWLKREKRMRQDDRLQEILRVAGLVLNPNTKPLAQVKRAFRFRDGLAHGRTETLAMHGHIEMNWSKPPIDPIETDWQKECTLENATEIVESCWALVEQIHHACKFKGRPFTSLGSGSYSFSRTDSAAR